MTTLQANNNHNFYFISEIDRAKCVYAVQQCASPEQLERCAREYREKCRAAGKPCDFATCRTEEELKEFKATMEADFEMRMLNEYREHVYNEADVIWGRSVTLGNLHRVCSQYDGKKIDAQFFKRLPEECDCAVVLLRSKMYFSDAENPDFDFSIYWPWSEGTTVDAVQFAQYLAQLREDFDLQENQLLESVNLYLPYIRNIVHARRTMDRALYSHPAVKRFALNNHFQVATDSCAWQ